MLFRSAAVLSISPSFRVVFTTVDRRGQSLVCDAALHYRLFLNARYTCTIPHRTVMFRARPDTLGSVCTYTLVCAFITIICYLFFL